MSVKTAAPLFELCGSVEALHRMWRSKRPELAAVVRGGAVRRRLDLATQEELRKPVGRLPVAKPDYLKVIVDITPATQHRQIVEAEHRAMFAVLQRVLRALNLDFEVAP